MSLRKFREQAAARRRARENEKLREKEMNKEILNYLNNEKLKNLLLNGLEESNNFKINEKAAEYFITSQVTPRKKQAAEALIKTNRYIPHDEFIVAFKILIEKFFNDINKKPDKDYIIISERKTKSGFFCTMIFLFLVQEMNYEMPKYIYTASSNTLEKIFKEYKESPNMNYVLINDADYSANQSVNGILDPLCKMLGKKKGEERTTFQKKLQNNFYVLRVFTNSHAIRRFTTTPPPLAQVWDCPDIKIKYIYAQSLLTLKEELEIKYSEMSAGEHENIYKDIISFFGGCAWGGGGSLMNIYFDHKIADYPSSTALALTLGIVPNNSAYQDDSDWTNCQTTYDKQKENVGEDENINNPAQLVIPLIENCKYEIIDNKYLENQGNYNTMRTIIEDADNVYPPGAAQLLRCPYAWYKKINYETGEVDLSPTRIYTTSIPPQLPFLGSPRALDFHRGASALLLKGGKKHKKRKRRKTRKKRYHRGGVMVGGGKQKRPWMPPSKRRRRRKQVFKGKLAKQTNVKFKTNVAKRTSSQSYYAGQPNLRSAPPNTSNTMYKWWLDEWDEFLDNQGVGKKYEGGKKYQRRTKRKTKRRRKTRKRRRKRTKRRRNK